MKLTFFFKILIILIAYVTWLWTQKCLGRRQTQNAIVDHFHGWTAPINDYLNQSPLIARILLISSSALVDLLGLYLIVAALFGTTIKPLVGLILIFLLRQLNQAVTLLPIPQGMIWKDPKFPSLFVTYKVSNDLFFSGHTAIAVYGSLMIYTNHQGILFSVLAIGIALYEIFVVLLLRAHWTLDVFTGAITALWIFEMTGHLSPHLDLWLSNL